MDRIVRDSQDSAAAAVQVDTTAVAMALPVPVDSHSSYRSCLQQAAGRKSSSAGTANLSTVARSPGMYLDSDNRVNVCNQVIAEVAGVATKAAEASPGIADIPNQYW